MLVDWKVSTLYLISIDICETWLTKDYKCFWHAPYTAVSCVVVKFGSRPLISVYFRSKLELICGYAFFVRYSQSLPRRHRSRSTTQSDHTPTPAARNTGYTPHHGDYECDEAPPQYDSVMQYNEPSPHYSARIKYNRNRELYAPTRTATHPHGTDQLGFYSSSTRQAIPYNTQPNHKPDNTTMRSVTRSIYNHVYSEDEGIVVNSESDSSGSQFATYDKQDTRSAPGQFSQSKYDSYARYNPQYQPVRANDPNYRNYIWDGANGAAYELRGYGGGRSRDNNNGE